MSHRDVEGMENGSSFLQSAAIAYTIGASLITALVSAVWVRATERAKTAASIERLTYLYEAQQAQVSGIAHRLSVLESESKADAARMSRLEEVATHMTTGIDEIKEELRKIRYER